MDPFSSGGNSSMPALPQLESTLRQMGQTIGMKPKNKNPRATFLGSDATPGPASANFGGKTLMGQ